MPGSDFYEFRVLRRAASGAMLTACGEPTARGRVDGTADLAADDLQLLGTSAIQVGLGNGGKQRFRMKSEPKPIMAF